MDTRDSDLTVDGALSNATALELTSHAIAPARKQVPPAGPAERNSTACQRQVAHLHPQPVNSRPSRRADEQILPANGR